jgi:hypothetical protein
MEGRDEFTVIPAERIEEVYRQPSIRTFSQPHRLTGMNR